MDGRKIQAHPSGSVDHGLTDAYYSTLTSLYPLGGPAAEKPLRRDVRTLGILLGRALSDLYGPELLRTVERLRVLSRAASAGDAGAANRLAVSIRRLSPQTLRYVVRAFLTFFQLTNLAEEHHRVRRRRALRIRPGAPTDPGSLAETLERLKAQGVPAARVVAALRRLKLKLVFTAHPTEVRRKTMLSKMRRLSDLLGRLDVLYLPQDEAGELLDRAAAEIKLLLATDPLRPRNPSPAEEADMGLWVLEDPLFDVLPRLHENLEETLARVYGVTMRLTPLVEFRTWIGGDRDGNPSVNAAVTRQVLGRMHERILRLYREQVRQLWDELSVSTMVADPGPALARSLARDLRELGAERDAAGRIDPAESVRRKVWAIHERLVRTAQGARDRYPDATALIADLETVRSAVEHAVGPLPPRHRLHRLIRQVGCFGFSFAPMEIRQHARVHRAALAELSAGRPGPVAREALATCRLPAWARNRLGGGTADSYIISGCESAADVLDLIRLLTAAGVRPDPRTHLRIVPLLESRAALEGAETMFTALWSDPAYRPWLAAAGGWQEVLFGYSDTAKEEGSFASTWLLHRTQDRLGRLAARHGVRLVCFQGRGGSHGRGGGGPIHRAIASMPADALRSGRLKLTQQGEVITALYSQSDTALHSLEEQVAALLQVLLRPTPAAGPAREQAADALASANTRAWRTLMTSPSLLEFLTRASPLAALGGLHVGSRPVARPGQRGLEGLRAIPLVFSWTQNRLLLPAWYGLGSAMATASPATLRALEGWPFWNTFLDFVEMAVAKTAPDLARRYAALAPAPAREAVWPLVRDELALTVEQVLRVRHRRALLEDEPDLARSIRLRSQYLEVLAHAQIELLRRTARQGPRTHAARRTLALTIHGIAAGMRNSG